MIDTKPPELPAYVDPGGAQWAVWCDHCQTWHRHGGEPGHRLAHCHRPGSPYAACGYTGVDAGHYGLG